VRVFLEASVQVFSRGCVAPEQEPAVECDACGQYRLSTEIEPVVGRDGRWMMLCRACHEELVLPAGETPGHAGERRQGIIAAALRLELDRELWFG
jgi:hypothetical protein